MPSSKPRVISNEVSPSDLYKQTESLMLVRLSVPRQKQRFKRIFFGKTVLKSLLCNNLNPVIYPCCIDLERSLIQYVDKFS